MAVDLSPVSLLDCGRSFDDTLIFGNRTAIAESTTLKLEFFGLDVCQGDFLPTPLPANVRNGVEQ